MGTLAEYKAGLTDSGRRVFNYAVDETRRRNQNYISPSHILNGFAHTELALFDGVMHSLSLDPDSVRTNIQKLLETTPAQSQLTFPPETANLFMRARGRARSRRNEEKIDATDLFVMLADEQRNSELIQILAEYGVAPKIVEAAVREMAEACEPKK
jgi:ATP-dependent Clp protease ATP-binding subunit ClpA